MAKQLIRHKISRHWVKFAAENWIWLDVWQDRKARANLSTADMSTTILRSDQRSSELRSHRIQASEALMRISNELSWFKRPHWRMTVGAGMATLGED